MLKPDGNIMLIDFGTAREYKGGQDGDTTFLGTRGYAAPEQFQGEQHHQSDARTDIYNLGATMYHLVTGKNPTKPPYEFLPIRRIDKTLSSGLESIILKCIANNPDDRYQTVEELEFALEHYQELEVESLKKQIATYHRWMTIGFIGILLCSISTGLRLYADSLLANTYDEELQNARISVTDEDQIKNYSDTIKLDPTRAEAFDEPLDNVYLKDGNFSQDEANQLTSLVGYKTNGKTVQDRFKDGNPEGYDEFAYNMGLAYFYYYETDGNKQLSKPWFDIARNSSSLEEQKKERASKFYQVADYYIQSGNVNKAGDTKVDYKDFYKQLMDISSDDIAKKDNIKTALVVYKELTFQLNTNGVNFYNAGIKIEDIKSELDTISKKTEELKSHGLKDDENELYDQIMTNIKTAKSNFDVVYSDRSNQQE